MLKRRAVHKDMAEANVYAARRLKDMAQSLGGLAKTFGRCREEPGLSREDGIAALEAASAMVCGACDSCGIQRECRRGGDDENYYLYYLLRTFEKKGCEMCIRDRDYIAAVRDIFIPLKTGATTCIIPNNEFAIPDKLLNSLNNNKITTICWSSAGLELCVKTGLFECGLPKHLNKILFSGSIRCV